MRTTDVIENRRQQIKRFINITNPGKGNEALRIDFDNLVRYLMQTAEIRFAASEYETLLKKELDLKIVNRLITPEIMDTISDYMWDLALCCTARQAKSDLENKELTRNRAILRHEEAEKLKAGRLK